jgi:hypothetical protein
MSQTDYFDVLPYHPQPKPFESLTGCCLTIPSLNPLSP